MTDELCTSLLRFEDPASFPVFDDQGGLDALIPPAALAYPSTAVAMAAAVGYGTWGAGYLLDEAVSPLAAAFGAPALAVTGGVPLYHQAGPLGAADFGIGFTAGAGTSFSGGNVFNVSGTDDLVLAWVGFHSAAPAAFRTIVGKGTGATPFYAIVVDNLGNLFARANDGTTLYSSSVALPIGKWYCAIAFIDRGAAKLRIATKTFDGVVSIGAAIAVPANAFASAGNFLFGASAGIDGCDHATISAMWINSGANVAATLNANIATAIANLHASLSATWPTRERSPCGYAAVFDGSLTALQAPDLANGSTALPRDVTVQGIIRWDFAAQNATGQSGTLIARGNGTALAEYMPFAVELFVVDVPTQTAGVRWLWHTSAGVLKTELGGAFFAPPSSQYFLVTATRHWTDATHVTIRYYINDQLLAESVSADGDIASSASGHTMIGARYTTKFANHFVGAIDELAIFNYEMTKEEIKALWKRLSLWQPDGYRQMLDSMPPGSPITDDPASRAQGDLQSMGAALGFSAGLIENMRENTMPDRAYGQVLKEWEAITAEPPLPGDSIDIRRARVIAHVQRRQGVSIPGVEIAIDKLLGVTAGQLQYLAFNNTIVDTFATLDAQRWFTPNAGVDVIGNELRLQIGNGLAAPWDDTHLGWGSAIVAMLPCASRPNRARGLLRAAAVAMLARLDIRTLPTGCEAGVVLASWSSDSRIFLGVRNTAGTFAVGYQVYKLAQQVTAWTQIALGPFANPVNLRMGTPSSGGFIGQIDEAPIAVASTDAASPWTEAQWLADQVSGIAIRGDMDWFGVYLRTFGTNVAGSAGDVRFLNTSAFRDLNSERPYYWYAYRDPALGGSPDFAGANRVIRRMRHAYTFAAAIASKSCLADDPGSLADFTPCGAI